MRFLGIDYGKKRVGLAISDDDLKIAFPYDVLPNDKNLVDNVVLICKKEKLRSIVIGESKTTSGFRNPLMKDIVVFKKRLVDKVDADIFMEPEYMTTFEAERFQESRKKVDASAAAIILQRFLEKWNSEGVQE